MLKKRRVARHREIEEMQISSSQKAKLLRRNSKKRHLEWFWGLPSAEQEKLLMEYMEFAKKRAEKLKIVDPMGVAAEEETGKEEGQEGENAGEWEEAEEDGEVDEAEKDEEGDEEMEG